MIHINTEVENMVVEIDDKEYPVAPKTIEIVEKLYEIEAAYQNKPQYKMWLAELAVLLGDNAVNELFHSGKAENIDRIQSIFSGVAQAFHYHANALSDEGRTAQMQAVATALAPVNELLRQVRALDKDEKKQNGIHRG